MTRPFVYRWVVALVVIIVVQGVASTAVDADVPRPADVTACNTEAVDAVGPGGSARGSAVPNPDDHRRAAEARQSPPVTEKATSLTASPDAQLEGMDFEGAKDPAYQAAFRGCMRRGGF